MYHPIAFLCKRGTQPWKCMLDLAGLVRSRKPVRLKKEMQNLSVTLKTMQLTAIWATILCNWMTDYNKEVKENYLVIPKYSDLILSLFTWTVDTNMNLNVESNHPCQRKDYHVTVLHDFPMNSNCSFHFIETNFLLQLL